MAVEPQIRSHIVTQKEAKALADAGFKRVRPGDDATDVHNQGKKLLYRLITDSESGEVVAAVHPDYIITFTPQSPAE